MISVQSFHLAQVNIGRMLAPLDDRLLAGFVARLDEINRLADASPGFVWRFQTAAGNATSLRPYDDDLMAFSFKRAFPPPQSEGLIVDRSAGASGTNISHAARRRARSEEHQA